MHCEIRCIKQFFIQSSCIFEKSTLQSTFVCLLRLNFPMETLPFYASPRNSILILWPRHINVSSCICHCTAHWDCLYRNYLSKQVRTKITERKRFIFAAKFNHQFDSEFWLSKENNIKKENHFKNLRGWAKKFCPFRW